MNGHSTNALIALQLLEVFYNRVLDSCINESNDNGIKCLTNLKDLKTSYHC